MDQLKFSLGQQVKIAVSGEAGEVVGRAEYAASEPNYYVRYCGKDGRATEAWWAQSALTAATATA